jgi:hypothetical protein
VNCRCGKPTRDNATVCDTDTAKLTRALAETPFLAEQIDITITRQRAAAIGGGGSKTSKEALVDYLAGVATDGLRGVQTPWHDKASEAKRDLHETLRSWVRLCAEENVRHDGGLERLPVDELGALSRWLMCRVEGLRFHDAGSDAVDEITAATKTIRSIVFWKRKSRVYLGACEQDVTDDEGDVLVESCPGDVYAEEGEPTGACDDCGQGVTVVIRQAELNKRLDSRLCTPAEIATYAVHLGLQAKRESVRRKVNHWAEHKRILKRGEAANGDPMFRYGEVRPLLYTHFGEKVKS